jgi:hypothetical protein
VTQVFNRYEVKYLLTTDQFDTIRHALLVSGHMRADAYNQDGETYPIQSLYFASVTDTVSQQALKLKSVDFKQRLRVRSYGPAQNDSPVFMEIKKKFTKKTFKRRVTMSLAEVKAFLAGEKVADNLVLKEVDHLMQRDPVLPVLMLAYDRYAMHATAKTSDLRISFDTNIRYQAHHLDLREEVTGLNIIPDGMVLMELKTELGLPTYIRDLLQQLCLRPTKYSKFELGLKAHFQTEDDAYAQLIKESIQHA